MAVGDVVSDLQSIATGAYLDIRPGSGSEWVIHNIYHADAAHLEFYDGSNSLIFDADSGPGFWAWYEFHCNNTRRIRVKNNAAGDQLIGYDGVQTK
ncbi:MAG TPA: hypothetical protein VLZ03_02175 [Thermodesulfobacteriota bacterium]|jgi:hypothetical protein|nr:hypothetical protein [Thermodesulfobacteriota bacterium]